MSVLGAGKVGVGLIVLDEIMNRCVLLACQLGHECYINISPLYGGLR